MCPLLDGWRHFSLKIDPSSRKTSIDLFTILTLRTYNYGTRARTRRNVLVPQLADAGVANAWKPSQRAKCSVRRSQLVVFSVVNGRNCRWHLLNSCMGNTTTTSYIEWNQMLGLCERLKADGRYRDYLLILVGSHFGLRASDLLSLRWDEVWDKEEVVVVERKTGKIRTIAIHHRVKQALKYCRPHYEGLSWWNRNSPLFANRNGKPIGVSYVNKRLKWIFLVYRVKTNKASSHVLRKTFGRALWSAHNESERALIFLSEIFGHSNTAVTRRYLGITQEEISDAYLKL